MSAERWEKGDGMRRALSVLLMVSAFAVAALAGCGGDEREATTTEPTESGDALSVPTFEVTSDAFAEGEPLPVEHTADGDNASPPLSWEGAPEADSFALIVDDPDAPTEQPFVHWVVYALPGNVTSLPGGVSSGAAPEGLQGGIQGSNGLGNQSYDGPAPPEGSGPHTYRFTVYALGEPLDFEPGFTKEELLGEIDEHVVAQGRLTGTYERE